MAIYDVYLQNRLTEMDAIITQLVQRDSFSAYNVMYLFCSMEELKLYKTMSGETSMEINVQLNHLLKTVKELMNSRMYLSARADLSSQVFSGGQVDLEMQVSQTDIREESFTGGSSVLEIFTAPLDYYIAHSFGTVDFDIQLEADWLSLVKEGFERIESEIQLLIDAEFSSSKIAEFEPVDMEILVSKVGLFYLAVISGELVLNLSASPLGDYILNKVLHNLNSEMTLSAINEKTPSLEKFTGTESLLQMLVSMAEILIQLVAMKQVDLILDCEASTTLRTYRFVSEMDNFNISDFDDMKLSEIDFKIID